MDTARRRRGRPPGTNRPFDSLDEYSKVETVEEQLDRVIDQRSELRAACSTDHGFEIDDEIA